MGQGIQMSREISTGITAGQHALSGGRDCSYLIAFMTLPPDRAILAVRIGLPWTLHRHIPYRTDLDTTKHGVPTQVRRRSSTLKDTATLNTELILVAAARPLSTQTDIEATAVGGTLDPAYAGTINSLTDTGAQTCFRPHCTVTQALPRAGCSTGCVGTGGTLHGGVLAELVPCRAALEQKLPTSGIINLCSGELLCGRRETRFYTG